MENETKTYEEFHSVPTIVVTASPQRVTMNVVQESDDYYILESEDHLKQTCRPKDHCKVEAVSFIVSGNAEIR